jgi:hypothetical protein
MPGEVPEVALMEVEVAQVVLLQIRQTDRRLQQQVEDFQRQVVAAEEEPGVGRTCQVAAEEEPGVGRTCQVVVEEEPGVGHTCPYYPLVAVVVEEEPGVDRTCPYCPFVAVVVAAADPSCPCPWPCPCPCPSVVAAAVVGNYSSPVCRWGQEARPEHR